METVKTCFVSNIVQGALDMKNKTAKDAMVPMDCVYMLNIDGCLDFDTMNEVTILWTS